jgi:hypothetical protein
MQITRRTGVLVISAVLALIVLGCAGVVPSNAWKPTETLPSNSYIYLACHAAAGSELYTQADTELDVSEYAGTVFVGGLIGPNVDAEFTTRAPFGRMVPGYYPGTQYPQSDPAVPAMQVYKTEYQWFCTAPTGWFAVDHLAYDDGGNMTALDLRFEQRCNGNAPALHGQIHWFADDPTQPPGPIVPPPGGLWAPAPASIPSTGNYAYLAGEPGNSILDGTSQLLAGPTADVSASAEVGDPELHVYATQGDSYVSGSVAGIRPTQVQLGPGYYGNAQMYFGPFGDERPGLEFHTVFGCDNYVDGWYVIDQISYSAPDVLQSVTLRFEQRCDGETASLHGQVHWST